MQQKGNTVGWAILVALMIAAPFGVAQVGSTVGEAMVQNGAEEGDGFTVDFTSLAEDPTLFDSFDGAGGVTIDFVAYEDDNDDGTYTPVNNEPVTIVLYQECGEEAVFGVLANLAECDDGSSSPERAQTAITDGAGKGSVTFDTAALAHLMGEDTGRTMTLVHVFATHVIGGTTRTGSFSLVAQQAHSEGDPASADIIDENAWQPVPISYNRIPSEMADAFQCQVHYMCDLWDGRIHIIEPKNTYFGEAGRALVFPDEDGFYTFHQYLAEADTSDSEPWTQYHFFDMNDGHLPWSTLGFSGTTGGFVGVGRFVEDRPDLATREFAYNPATDSMVVEWRVHQDILDGTQSIENQAENPLTFLPVGDGSISAPVIGESNVFYKQNTDDIKRVGQNDIDMAQCNALDTSGDGTNTGATNPQKICPYTTGLVNFARAEAIHHHPGEATLGQALFTALDYSDPTPTTFQFVNIPVQDVTDGYAVHITAPNAIPDYDGSVHVPAVNDAYDFWVEVNEVPSETLAPSPTEPGGEEMLAPRQTDNSLDFQDAPAGRYFRILDYSSIDPNNPGTRHDQLTPIWECSGSACDDYIVGSRLRVPASEVDQTGPVALQAYIDLDPAKGTPTLDSASGYFNSAKNYFEGYAISDRLDWMITPVILGTAENVYNVDLVFGADNVALGEEQEFTLTYRATAPAQITIVDEDGAPVPFAGLDGDGLVFAPEGASAPVFYTATTRGDIGDKTFTVTMTSPDGDALKVARDFDGFEVLPDTLTLGILADASYVAARGFSISVTLASGYFETGTIDLTAMVDSQTRTQTVELVGNRATANFGFDELNAGSYTLDVSATGVGFAPASASAPIEMVPGEPTIAIHDDVRLLDPTTLEFDFNVFAPSGTSISDEVPTTAQLTYFSSDPRPTDGSDVDMTVGTACDESDLGLLVVGAAEYTGTAALCTDSYGWYVLEVTTAAAGQVNDGDSAIFVKILQSTATTFGEVTIADAPSHLTSFALDATSYLPGGDLTGSFGVSDANGITRAAGVEIDLKVGTDVFATLTCTTVDDPALCPGFSSISETTTAATLGFSYELTAPLKDQTYTVDIRLVNTPDNAAPVQYDGVATTDDFDVTNVDPVLGATWDAASSYTPTRAGSLTATLSASDANFGIHAGMVDTTELTSIAATLSGPGFDVGHGWAVSLDGAGLGPAASLTLSGIDTSSAERNPDGSLTDFTATVTVPEGVAPGTYTLRVTLTDDDTETAVVPLEFTVVDLPAITSLTTSQAQAGDMFDITATISTTEAALTQSMVDNLLVRVSQMDDSTTDYLDAGSSTIADWAATPVVVDGTTQSVDVTLSFMLPERLEDDFGYTVDAVVVPGGMYAGATTIDELLVNDPATATCSATGLDGCRNTAATPFTVLAEAPTIEVSGAPTYLDGAASQQTWAGDQKADGSYTVYLPPGVGNTVTLDVTVDDANWGTGTSLTSTELTTLSLTATGADMGATLDTTDFSAATSAPGTATVTAVFSEEATEGTYTISATIADDDGLTDNVLLLTIIVEPWFHLDIDDSSDGSSGVAFATDDDPQTGECDGCAGDVMTSVADPLSMTLDGSIGAKILLVSLTDFKYDDGTDVHSIDSDEVTAFFHLPSLADPVEVQVVDGQALLDPTTAGLSDELLLAFGSAATVHFEFTVPENIPHGAYTTQITVEAFRAAQADA